MKRTLLISFRIIIILFFLEFCSISAYATHIVGGEMNYRCLGNDLYEISLVVFRDCDTGIPWFDDPASIGVFDPITNDTLFEQRISLDNAINDTLDIYLPDTCLIVPSTACIHTTTYIDTITLPFRTSGYIIAYQRCCRNQDIVNIINPEDAGSTYWSYISPTALQLCNSSAVFKEWPRVYLCSGVPISFDHSADDIDGDSIVYELCTPFHGASDVLPIPQPPNPPPYTNINWLSPYGLNNMFGGADPLVIDPVTGLLTGTPQNMGVFLVGVCLNEYRNGILISSTHRDFQHIVGTCDRMTIAEFDTTGLSCNTDLIFPFNNTSQVVSGTYNWLFDTLFATTQVNPTFTFPDTGIYDVTLVAGIGSPCIDTFAVEMNVEIEAIDLSVLPPQIACLGDSIWIVASDAYKGFSDSTNYTWAPDSLVLYGQGTDSVLVFANQTTQFSVYGVNNYGCSDNASATLTVQQIDASFIINIPPCNTSFNVQFQNNSTSNPQNNNYQWQFDTLGFGTATNPTFTFPDTGSYTVTLVAGAGAVCPDTISIPFDLTLTGIELGTIPSQTICNGDSVWLKANNLYSQLGATSYTWIPSASIILGQGTDSVLLIPNNSIQVQVLGTNIHGCSDSVNLDIDVVVVEAFFDTINLQCNTSLTIPFLNTSTNNLPVSNYQWQFDTLGYGTATNPTFTFPDTGLYNINLIADFEGICPDTFNMNVYIPLHGLDLDVDDVQVICKEDTVLLTVGNSLDTYTDYVNYQWYPDGAIISGQGTDSAYALIDTFTNFTVIGVNSHGCIDTALAQGTIINISPPLNIIALPDSVFVGETTQLISTNDIDYVYNWIPDTTLSDYYIFNPEAKPRITTVYYLIVTNEFGCKTIDSVIVNIREPICGLPMVFVPNAFTPDGDGYNDVLMVNGNNITQVTISVYNRWGQKVFESNDQNIGWDGKFNGNDLPPDVYGYYMKCTCDNGSDLFVKGNITLLR
ncbi:MAG: gliding motility-associated C-terminal domain-containing protein [Saprospiraceae bacterium]|nr:gliding motility-associated C-terminal domain-containing protein [Saprospiraceae bacterium]